MKHYESQLLASIIYHSHVDVVLIKRILQAPFSDKWVAMGGSHAGERTRSSLRLCVASIIKKTQRSNGSDQGLDQVGKTWIFDER